MLLLLVKWMHVLAAITAVGANLTYGIWISRASRDAKVLPFVLRNIRWIDNRVANPCYVLLLATGLMMGFLLRIPLTTPWLLTAIVLYAGAALLGVFGYSPVLKLQIQLLESNRFDSAAFRTAANRNTLFGILATLDVVMILFLMVVKPTLWG